MGGSIASYRARGTVKADLARERWAFSLRRWAALSHTKIDGQNPRPGRHLARRQCAPRECANLCIAAALRIVLWASDVVLWVSDIVPRSRDDSLSTSEPLHRVRRLVLRDAIRRRFKDLRGGHLIAGDG